MRLRRPSLAVGALGIALLAAPAARADDLGTLEKALRTRYPKVAGPALLASPYPSRPMRTLFASGAVGVWYQKRSDRLPLCAAARANSLPLRDAIVGQIMPTADDVRFWASKGVSPTRGVEAYRSGIVYACKLRKE